MSLKTALPPDPGSYILELHLAQTTRLQIASLGQFTFPAGGYLYFGSAHGPGGLRARINRHLSPAKTRPMHWHIDYLRAAAEVRALGYVVETGRPQTAKSLECLWRQAIASLPESSTPVTGFGASDCRCHCRAHLLAFNQPGNAPGFALLDEQIQNMLFQVAKLSPDQPGFGWFGLVEQVL